ncbi:glycine oxidase ThiO [Pilimelia columellifera subsp. columellifera]|uniref:glycine oxidase n=1 Tax=Pilimelia columellifera subsp. columellifera TaxID=706583 RepID=A0ABN3NFD6_9ACTN
MYDPGRAGPTGAWSVAAGMLAPVAEAYFGERELTALLLHAGAGWPAFAAELGAVADIGYRAEGTLVAALTADDLAEAHRLIRYQAELGLPIEALRGPAVRELAPLLASRVRGGAFAAADHCVDPRRLVAALRQVAESAGVVSVDALVVDLYTIDADVVVVAAGCGSAALTGLPVRPVKGQVLRLRAPDGQPPGFRHMIRGFVDGRRVYLAPRSDGEVVVGATAEERGDAVPTAGGAFELLRAAIDLLPELSEYALVEVGVGHRPGTPDNGPILGWLPSSGPRVLAATGHYRHGILLAPATADAVATMIDDGPPAAAWAPYRPGRFTQRKEDAHA